MKTEVINFQDLIKKNIPFAAWRMPGTESNVLMIQKNKSVQEFLISELESKNGFIIAHFDSYITGKAYFVEPDFLLRNLESSDELKQWIHSLPEEQVLLGSRTTAINQLDYLSKVELLVTEMQKGELDKVVFSRVLHEDLPEHFALNDFFNLLEKTYPRAFVYLFFLPGKGLWCGASPETLISRKKDSYETMALAGTQLKSDSGEVLSWKEKEIQEQAFVTHFIDEQLKKLEISLYKKNGPETVFAGQLAHLCTQFSIPEIQVSGKIGSLVKALHPTPAVCGLPRDKAADLILKTEPHNRTFYTGFLGPWNVHDDTQLFVNLRCAKILDNELEVYVGGGLTADSIPEKEWQETQYKSRTMLSVLEKIRNFAP
ncbi:MAG: isochorismate synthase [Bacteroidales bacterium]|nr:isochorismate synthase [Bacteroidales bacterium]